MLLNYDPRLPVHVIGDGVVARQMHHRLMSEAIQGKLIPVSEAEQLPRGGQCIMGFMNHGYRRALLKRVAHLEFIWPTYIHPSAVVETSELGQGVTILDQVHVGFEARIGDWCYLDTRVTICHGSSLGQHCVLTVGTLVAGSTNIGNNVVTGLNTLVRNKISICDDVTFAMNSVVSRSISEPGNYYGIRHIAHVDL